MEVGKPAQAADHFGLGNTALAGRETAAVQIFQHHQHFIVVMFQGQTMGDAAVVITACGPMFVPGGFHLIGVQFALVGSIGVPATRVSALIR
jgi:hypothetical protein